MAETTPPKNVVVIGAGPAGLTAAYQLGKEGVDALVLEADTVGATDGASTSVVTASSRRSRRWKTSGTRFSPKATSYCARG